MRKTLILLVLCAFAAAAHATTVSGQFALVTNDGNTYSVKVQLEVGVAAGLGGASLQFTFNTGDMSYPTSPVSGTDYTFAAFSGGNYFPASVTQPAPGKLSVNIEYNGSVGLGTVVGTSPTDVVTINFKILNPQGHANLVWTLENLIADDQITAWSNGTFTPLDTGPLPIQLSDFTAGAVAQKGVTLSWSTTSETHNYGFEVQRSLQQASGFSTLNGSFQKGYGTTVVRHSYSYTDGSVGAGVYYYRLRQMDLDGAQQFSEAVKVTSLGGANPLPTEFALKQNYPNPFNPTTMIEFDLPKDAHVKIEVYNILGQKMATLLDEVRTAGVQHIAFNGASYASGVYLFRMSAGDKSFMRKMTLLK